MGNRQPHHTDPSHVALGEHIYEVVPQKLGRLKRQLGHTLDNLADSTVERDNFLGMIGDQAYTILAVFIPDLMPKWEWDGYGSESAADEDLYDESGDRSPDADQIVTAFQVAMKVNRLDLFKHLGQIVDPSMLRDVARDAVTRMGNSSPDSTNAATDGTTLTTTVPTSEDQPEPVSVG